MTREDLAGEVWKLLGENGSMTRYALDKLMGPKGLSLIMPLSFILDMMLRRQMVTEFKPDHFELTPLWLKTYRMATDPDTWSGYYNNR